MRISHIYAIFFVVLLVTEFFYVQVGEGVARLYHLIAPLIFLSLIRYLPRLFASRVAWALLGFLVINFLAALFSNYPAYALASFLSLMANVGIAMTVGLILVSGRYDFERLRDLVLKVTVLAVFFGVFQVMTNQLFGVELALSEEQKAQISSGFAPAFRTEANTFAKYLNFVFLLVLPSLLRDKNLKKSLAIFTILFVGMLISLTRSALYGLSLTLILAYFWYAFTGRGRVFAPRVMALLGIGGVALFIFATQVSGFNEYAAFKLGSFFDKNELLEGGSSGFRLMSQQYVIDAFLATDKTILIGNGWGQVFFDYADSQWQAGGAEMLLVLAYGGIISGLFYLMYSLIGLNECRRLVNRHRNDSVSAGFEGLMFAILGSVITGQINGALIAPEYWLMYGMAVYLGYLNKVEKRSIYRSLDSARNKNEV